MNQKFSYLLNVVLAVGLFLLVFRFGCKNEPAKVITKEIIDSNLFYDEIEVMWQSKQLALYDSIEILNKRLKTPKTIFKTKYYEILKDTTLVDSNCLTTLYYANETINQQDSLLNLQSRGLDACSSQVNNLRKQVDHNQDLKAEYQNLYKEEFKLNQKLERKVKRNRLFSWIVSGILVSFVLIK